MLSKVVNENHDDWDEWIPHVLLAYRTAAQSSTGFTPHKILFGREARIPIDLMLGGTNRSPLCGPRHANISPRNESDVTMST